MRQLNKPIRKYFTPVKLYLNDLENIYNILKEYTNNVDIYTDNYRVEDIQKLKNLEVKKEHYLFIRCRDPNIELVFRPNQADIYFSEDTITNRGILSKIEEVLDKSKVHFGRFLISNWMYLIFLLIFFGLMPINNLGLSYFNWIIIAYLVIVIFLVALLYNFATKSYSTIVYINKKDESSFWKRNKDKIWVAIISGTISAIIGAAIGSWITYLITK